MMLYLSPEEFETLRAGLVMMQVIRGEQDPLYKAAGDLLDLIDLQRDLWFDINEVRAITRKEKSKMKVFILGFRPVEYRKKTGQKVTGASVYYAAEAENTVGLRTDNVWVSSDKSALYAQVLALQCSGDPIPAEMVFDFRIGSRYPDLVSIKLLPVKSNG